VRKICVGEGKEGVLRRGIGDYDFVGAINDGKGESAQDDK